MSSDSPPDFTEGASNVGALTRLNVFSLLAQAGYNLKEGNTERAMLLFGAAALAPHSSKLSYAIQGGLAAKDVLEKFTDVPEPSTGGTDIPIE
ncbi:hypothetical protein BRD01_01980 [Halobacteriales archaeon QS_8_65_32]|jgi:hypothetical protein|nr:MAG: hypothetical protein BRD01_01980 [Halobacteriales archaeon QS_8_65_32]